MMATKREKVLARKLLAMHRDHEAQAADPDAHNVAFEELALKLARLCVGTKP